MPIPVEIIGLGRPRLRVVWDEDHESIFDARELRIGCGCAHCVDEMTGRPLLDPATVPSDLTVEDIQLVGGYGLAIRFSDGHDTGIYRFADLLDACTCARCQARRPPP